MKCTALFLLVSCAWASAQTNGLNFEDKAVGFALDLPAGWVEFPKESIFRVAGFGASLEPRPPAREFLAAFQRGSDLEHPGFPRIIVHAQKSEISEEQFRGMHSAPLFGIEIAESLGFSGRPRFMSSARYDSARQCLEFNFDCYLEDRGFVRGAGRSFLTDRGLVNVYGYALGGDFDAFEREFEKIAFTARLASEHRYQPRAGAEFTLQKPGGDFRAMGLVVGAVCLVGMGWLVSRRKDMVWSDEI